MTEEETEKERKAAIPTALLLAVQLKRLERIIDYSLVVDIIKRLKERRLP